jgi:hypothetical protein
MAFTQPAMDSTFARSVVPVAFKTKKYAAVARAKEAISAGMESVFSSTRNNMSHAHTEVQLPSISGRDSFYFKSFEIPKKGKANLEQSMISLSSSKRGDYEFGSKIKADNKVATM